MSFTLRTLPLAAISARADNRPVDLAWVEALAVSITEVGLINRIRVREIATGPVTSFELISGEHRLEALRLLGREEAEALVGEITDDEAQLQSLHENLVRNELSDLERAIALDSAKQLHERLHPETTHGGDRKRQKQAGENQVAMLATWSRYSKEAARKTGLSERTTRRAVLLVQGLAPEALALIRGTALADNQAQLLKLGRLPAAEQVLVAKALTSGIARNVKAARVAAGLDAPVERDPQQDVFEKLIVFWSRANAKTKRRFLDHEELAEAPKAARLSKVSGQMSGGAR